MGCLVNEIIKLVTKQKKRKTPLSKQVATVAGAVVSKKNYVSAIDLFLGMGWLAQDKLSDWKAGKIPYLESVVTVNLKKISTAMKAFILWAEHSKLKASITVYKHKNHMLRFSKSGNHKIETAYSTHYVLLKPKDYNNFTSTG